MVLVGLALLCVGPAQAGELVHIPVAAGPLSITGLLSKPAGPGPFPAAVVLHSCLGPRADAPRLAALLNGWGYVTLFVDDFSARGLKETCAVDFPQGVADAYGGLGFLATLPEVDAARIAALGYSQGADTVLKLATGMVGGFRPASGGPRFRAAIAYYPPCQNEAGQILRLPTLVMVGANDTVTPAAACERLLASQPTGVGRLMVLSGAAHVFDDPAFARGRTFMGMWLEYDAEAAAAARRTLRRYLAEQLGR